MKRFILASTIFCICACATLKAQIPGYMGKRFTLSYNAYMAPNFNDYINLDDRIAKVPLRLNTKHIFEADYVIGRRISAGFELGFMRHNAPYRYQLHTYSQDNPQYNYYTTDYKVGNIDLNGFAAGINFKFYGLFSKNTLAPLGSYFVLNAQRLSYNLTDEIGAKVTESIADTVQNRAVTAKAAGYMFGLGFGTKRVYYDKVTLDFSINSGLAVVLPKEESVPHAGNFITEYAIYRHALMYKIGIGGLLF